MSLNTTLRVLHQGQRYDVYSKTTIAKVDGLSSRLSTIDGSISTNAESIGTLNTSVSGLSSRMTTAEGNITTLQSGKADKDHKHKGTDVYIGTSLSGTTLNTWATSIESGLSDLAGGLQYKGVFTTDTTLQALLEATTSKAGSYFVYNGSSAYTIPASLGDKTITIDHGDDGSSTERVIERNDYVVLNEELTNEYKISIINNTHGSATTSKEGLVKLASASSTGNEVITASVLNSKLPTSATTTAEGLVKLATVSETSGDNVITAGVLNSKLPTSATTSKEGLVKLATGSSTGSEVITASVLNAKNYQPAGSYAKTNTDNTFASGTTQTFGGNFTYEQSSTNIFKATIMPNITGGFPIQVVPNVSGQKTTTFNLIPTSLGGTETIIHTGNIGLYAEKGMPLLTSAQESSFTDENVIYAVLDA